MSHVTRYFTARFFKEQDLTVSNSDLPPGNNLNCITTQFGKIYHCQRLCCTTQCQFLLLLYNTLKDTSRREPIWIHFCPGKKTYSCLFYNTSLFASPSQNPLSSRIQHASARSTPSPVYLRTREVETTYSIIPRANLESSRAAAHVALPEHARDTQ